MSSFEGEDIRGPNIPKRQQPESLDRITQYAINMIPINGKPFADDESAFFEGDNSIDSSNQGQ